MVAHHKTMGKGGRTPAGETEAVRQHDIEPPSPDVDEIVAWMQELVAPDQTVAVWCKEALLDGETRCHVGGYYTAEHLDQLVADAMEYSGRSVGVHFAINPVDPALLDRADHRLQAGVAPPAHEHVLRRRILPIDIDPERPADISATEEEKQRARAKMQEVGLYLAKLGWPRPAIVDSGNGYYLLYRVDLPADDGGVIKRVLKALKQRFADEHVEIDTTVANAARVLKIPGTMACKGKPTPERPHRPSRVMNLPADGLQVVPRHLLDKVAGEVDEPEHAAWPESSLSVPPDVVERARHYVAKIPPAISGQRGHSTTLTVANCIVVGFAIPHDSDAARHLMQEYNGRCQPPWKEKDLCHKLQEADRLARETGETRGALRRGQGQVQVEGAGQSWVSLAGADFLGEVPDYGYSSTDFTLMPNGHLSKFNPLFGLVVFRLWADQRSDAVVPDILARQVHWGAFHPLAWKRTLRKHLSKFLEWEDCRPDCPLNASGVRHGHFVLDQKVPNGLLEKFVAHPAKGREHEDEDDDDDDDDDDDERDEAVTRVAVAPPDGLPGARQYHFLSEDEHWVKLRTENIKKGLAYLAYYPVLVFGRSPRVGLTWPQVRLMMGITRELTRVGYERTGRTSKGGKPQFRRAGSYRQDKADVIERGKVINSGRGRRKVVCPHLDPARQYVAFAGNYKSHRGRGYRIVSQSHGCWLDHAGYLPEDYHGDPWPCVRSFLDDLAVLADKFDLVPVGRHHADDQWRSLAEMRACLDTGSGREWLGECMLRVYGPADYQVRWRYYFSRWLGFRWIPGGAECPFEDDARPEETGTIRDGVQLRVWLDERGLTQQQLADAIGYRRESVSRYMSGKRNASMFWAAVNRFIRSHG